MSSNAPFKTLKKGVLVYLSACVSMCVLKQLIVILENTIYLTTDGTEGGQSQQEFAETDGLVGVLGATVLFQGTLGLLLEALDVGHIRQAACVWNNHTCICQ